jgi:hypothetical protein
VPAGEGGGARALKRRAEPAKARSAVAGLRQVAESLSPRDSEGRLCQVYERWIYSAVLCFALDTTEQDFHYSYSVFQGEYSRSLRFRSGAEINQAFQRLIERVRGALQLKDGLHLTRAPTTPPPAQAPPAAAGAKGGGRARETCV